MTSNRKTPSRRRAVDFILDGIERGRFVRSQVLPSVSRLAELAGVSPVTMHKAIAELKDRGVLGGHFGQRTLVLRGTRRTPRRKSSARDTGEAPLTTQTTSQKVASLIERDILNGLYPSGSSLGSYKELAGRYQCCYRTLKSAIRLLIDDKIVTETSRHLLVSSSSLSAPRSRIVMLGCMDEEGNLIRGVGGEDFMRFVEFECSKAGLRLSTRMYYLRDGTLQFRKLPSRKPARLDDDESVLGYIYISVWEEDPWKSVVKLLARKRKPAAVFTHRKNMVLPGALEHSSLLKKFLVGGTTAPGVCVGRLLLGLGHRSIAYFSPFHKINWSRERLAGLRDVARAGGTEATVVPFTINQYTRTAEYLPSALRHWDLAPLLDSYERWLQGAPETLRSRVEPEIESSLKWAYLAGEVYRHMEPLFRKALAVKKITAWVAANDNVAAMMLDFLARKKVPVPDRLSVVSFDNSTVALRNYLTSYDFNMQQFASAIVSFILKKGYFARSRKETELEIEGTLVERMTTGAVRHTAL